MIRGFFILVGLLLGLSLAVISEARIHHLRSVAQRIDMPLPLWTQSLASDAGILMGQLSEANTLLLPHLPATDLGWKFQGLNQRGLRYTVTLKGDGITLQGKVLLPYSGALLKVTDLRGTLGISHLLLLTETPDLPLTGQIQIDGVAVQLDYKTREVLALSGETTLHHLRFDGTDLGATRLVFTPAEVGNWQASIDLTTGPLHMLGQVSGVLGQSSTMLEGRVTQGKDMPEGWLRWLNQNLPRGGGGWKVEKSLHLEGLTLSN